MRRENHRDRPPFRIDERGLLDGEPATLESPLARLRRFFCRHSDCDCPPIFTITTAEAGGRHVGASRSEFPRRDHNGGPS